MIPAGVGDERSRYPISVASRRSTGRPTARPASRPATIVSELAICHHRFSKRPLARAGSERLEVLDQGALLLPGPAACRIGALVTPLPLAGLRGIEDASRSPRPRPRASRSRRLQVVHGITGPELLRRRARLEKLADWAPTRCGDTVRATKSVERRVGVAVGLAEMREAGGIATVAQRSVLGLGRGRRRHRGTFSSRRGIPPHPPRVAGEITLGARRAPGCRNRVASGRYRYARADHLPTRRPPAVPETAASVAVAVRAVRPRRAARRGPLARCDARRGKGGGVASPGKSATRHRLHVDCRRNGARPKAALKLRSRRSSCCRPNGAASPRARPDSKRTGNRRCRSARLRAPCPSGSPRSASRS